MKKLFIFILFLNFIILSSIITTDIYAEGSEVFLSEDFTGLTLKNATGYDNSFIGYANPKYFKVNASGNEWKMSCGQFDSSLFFGNNNKNHDTRPVFANNLTDFKPVTDALPDGGPSPVYYTKYFNYVLMSTKINGLDGVNVSEVSFSYTGGSDKPMPDAQPVKKWYVNILVKVNGSWQAGFSTSFNLEDTTQSGTFSAVFPQGIKIEQVALVTLQPDDKVSNTLRISNMTIKKSQGVQEEQEVHNVSFYDEDLELLSEYNVLNGDTISSIPDAPDKEGYKFVGWECFDGNIEGEMLTLDTPITDSLIFIPLYKEVVTIDAEKALHLDAIRIIGTIYGVDIKDIDSIEYLVCLYLDDDSEYEVFYPINKVYTSVKDSKGKEDDTYYSVLQFNGITTEKTEGYIYGLLEVSLMISLKDGNTIYISNEIVHAVYVIPRNTK